MKSQFQTLSFLNNYFPKSALDAEMISSFVEKRFNITPTTTIFADGDGFPTIDSQSFIQWFDSGYGPSDIVWYRNNLAILGKCTLQESVIIGTLTSGKIITGSFNANTQELYACSREDEEEFKMSMMKNRIQYNERSNSLMQKYIPYHDEKVIFHNLDYSVTGLGIVRSVDTDTHKVELYCYFIYPSKSCERQIGYSMHEENVVDLVDYYFEPMMEDDKRASTLNGASCLKRLNRELNRENKVWKDKLHRIEPLSAKVAKGEKYWYISDKLKVVQEVEKDTPTSHFRYLAGNYFITQMSANIMLSQVCDLLQGYLASPVWPEI